LPKFRFGGIWQKRPIEDTEPRVQQLFDGLYPERDIGSQDLAGAGLCVVMNSLYIILYLVLIVGVPLFLLYFFSNYNWKFQKISKEKKEKAKEKSTKEWRWFGRLLGAILIFASFGAPLPSAFNKFQFLQSELFLVRAITLAVGVLFIYIAGKKPKKDKL